MTRIGVYTRISEDRDGTATAPARQRADCEAFAARQGWEVAETFEDRDLSAYRRDVTRPEFERLLAGVKAGEIEGVVAWKLDRLTRRQRDLVRLDEVLEDAGGFIATVADGIDTRTPTGRFVSELMVAQARMESENTATRVRRKHAERAQQGKPNPGGRRPFGYSPSYDAIVEPEATLIREARDRVFAGEALRAIVRDWYSRGVRTSGEKVWPTPTLRRMLISPTISGQRDYEGSIVVGTWPGIVSPADTVRLRAILCDPSRVHRAAAPRSYLLSGGIARCGRCTHPLIARPGYKGKRRYVCAANPGSPNCGRLARQAEPVEHFVAQSIFEALRGVELSRFVADPEDDPEGVVQLVRADEQQLDELAEDYGAKRITRREWHKAREVVLARLEEHRRKLARRANGPLRAALDAGAALEHRWESESLDWRRAVVQALIESVAIKPAKRGRAQFDPDAVEIVWKF